MVVHAVVAVYQAWHSILVQVTWLDETTAEVELVVAAIAVAFSQAWHSTPAPPRAS